TMNRATTNANSPASSAHPISSDIDMATPFQEETTTAVIGQPGQQPLPGGAADATWPLARTVTRGGCTALSSLARNRCLTPASPGTGDRFECRPGGVSRNVLRDLFKDVSPARLRRSTPSASVAPSLLDPARVPH